MATEQLNMTPRAQAVTEEPSGPVIEFDHVQLTFDDQVTGGRANIRFARMAPRTVPATCATTYPPRCDTRNPPPFSARAPGRRERP